jgi:hypothetical protein
MSQPRVTLTKSYQAFSSSVHPRLDLRLTSPAEPGYLSLLAGLNTYILEEVWEFRQGGFGIELGCLSFLDSTTSNVQVCSLAITTNSGFSDMDISGSQSSSAAVPAPILSLSPTSVTQGGILPRLPALTLIPAPAPRQTSFDLSLQIQPCHYPRRPMDLKKGSMRHSALPRV